MFYPRENRFVFYVLDYKDKDELVDFSNLIVDTLRSIFVTERIGGGIGIVEIEQDQNDFEVDLLLSRLLIASEKSVSVFGRDFEICFYDEELEAVVEREREIIKALSAIAADEDTNNDIFLQYQPIVDLKTSSVIAFEALARLRTEKLGTCPTPGIHTDCRENKAYSSNW